MKSKKRVLSTAALLLLLCIISTVMISGTFAEYTSTYYGTDTAIVAKWEFVASDQDDKTLKPEGDSDQRINLFKQTDGPIMDKIKEGGEDYTVIAPGVEGSFILQLVNKSNIAAKIEFDVKKNIGVGFVDVPMVYSISYSDREIKDISLSKLTDELNDLDIVLDHKDGDTPNDNVTVHWQWKLDGDDTIDTGLGTYDDDLNKKYSLTIGVTATQVTK
ncbi:MAG: hypothetical protein ACOX47_06025 [Bacillota bacterium]|jgi:hypothetical protein